MGEFRSFEELTVWKLARRWRQRVYEVSEGWPKREVYGLTAQVRGAAVSVTANIAEGYGRYHYQENIQHCRIARGSVNEVLDHVYAALDAGYISQEVFAELYAQGREVERVLNGYINYLRRQLQGGKGERGKVEKGRSGEVEKGGRGEGGGVREGRGCMRVESAVSSGKAALTGSTSMRPAPMPTVTGLLIMNPAPMPTLAGLLILRPAPMPA